MVATEKCVSWTQFLTVIGIMVAGFGSLTTFVWANHSAHPHAGAVTAQEMSHIEKRFDTEFRHIREELLRIRKSNEEIRETLNKR